MIGVVTAVEQTRYSVWDAPCALLQMNYIRMIQQAGGMAILIPPDPELVADPDQILDRIDALILAGGSDVDPANYGSAPAPQTTHTTPVRDEIEIALLQRALERDMPVLGICRGMQVLNIVRGGDLIQHLPTVTNSDEHVRRPGVWEGGTHAVALTPGSLAERAVGADHATVYSQHHQAIGRLGNDLTVTGTSPDDGVIEAVELTDHDYVLGVQWHPEADTTSTVIKDLVEHARTVAREDHRHTAADAAVLD
jgi:putative glutamine amidotransferase